MRVKAQNISEPVIHLEMMMKASEARGLARALQYMDRMLPDHELHEASIRFADILMKAANGQLLEFDTDPEGE